MNAIDTIGAIGVGLILLAYFFNILSWIKKDGIVFYVLNIIGASIACLTSYLIDYTPFVILEGTWVMVSIFGLVKSLKKPQG
jgi:hypothetical protein